MPKDKTATHAKLYECMRAEFLEKGYEKASLNNIARQCGITPAAVYRHYSSKEAMFEALVKPALDDFETLCSTYMNGMDEEIRMNHSFVRYSPFDGNWLDVMIDFIYRYFDEFRLLVVGSKGTKYENFLEQLVTMEEQSSKQMYAMLDASGISYNTVTDEQLHIAVTAYITALFEIIRHEMPKAKAIENIKFIYNFFSGAWKSMLKIKQ